ncbi:hypothetical protein SGFS_079230 [Streptomyces graminofaciens]|uniref:Uncharacterized protein n=1 Tax=Streptomyces graminofaciens TaxID=68212 RepID=A0ABM7FJH6_9ACTN|nr:hypothetical protein SGFS_079230 [Streptomyces graminofaciens]
MNGNICRPQYSAWNFLLASRQARAVGKLPGRAGGGLEAVDNGGLSGVPHAVEHGIEGGRGLVERLGSEWSKKTVTAAGTVWPSIPTLNGDFVAR